MHFLAPVVIRNQAASFESEDDRYYEEGDEDRETLQACRPLRGKIHPQV